ncbi:MAG: TonB-dependent receptor [Ginsengibacter sp.]
MKLTAILLFAACLQVSATGYSQKITLSQNNVSLKKVFKGIEKQSSYQFFYKDRLVSQAENVSIHVTNASIEEVLNECLKGLPLSYTILDKIIVVKAKPSLPVAIQALAVLPAVPLNIITGTVKDQLGNPLAGVSVIVKGTNKGTSTKADGRFSIEANVGEVLELTIVGYQKRSVTVGQSNNLNVVMEIEAALGNEVVVVGYGTQKRRDLTGSISSIKGDDIKLLPTQRVDQALQGRAAGVLVLNTAGAPGAEATIRIRGMNSINGGNNALIVIDGLQGGDLNSLNPNDIAGIEVLKDASATAIYGSMGANGVILVTTKRGSTGKPTINYSFSYGSQKIRNKLDLMNAADYAKTRNAFHASENLNGTPTPYFTEDQIKGFERNGGTDWQDVIYHTAPVMNQQLGLSGGTDKLKYMISGGYLDQQGILVNSAYKRYTLRANINADITKGVSFGLNWAGSKEEGNSPPYGGGTALSFTGQAVNIAPRWAPTAPVYDSSGAYSRPPKSYGAYDTWNPLAAAKEPDIRNNTIRNNINTYLDFDIISGLKLRIMGGAILRNTNNKSYYNSLTREGQPVGGQVGYGTLDDGLLQHFQNSNTLTYDKRIGQLHHLTVLAVVEQQYEKYETSGLVAQKFTLDQTGINDLGGADQISSKYSNVEKRVINSYLGRLNYSYADKYLLTASFRADGSSVFGKNNKWGYFPSASVAWRLIDEDFIKSLNFFSDLKIRGSYGITGNQAISPYQTLSLMSSGFNYPYSGGESTNLGFIIANAANPNLKWENTSQTDIGLDIGFFDGRLNATIDVYKKLTTNLLLNRTLPSYSGLRSIIDNVGSVENKGLELAISGDPLTGIVRWNSGFNISWNRNKVLNLGENDRINYRTTYGGYGLKNGFMQLRVGEPFGQIYGYGYEGTWKLDEAAEAAAFGQLPGDPKYTDFNKDGKINAKDIMKIGNTSPDFIFGWSNRVTYKSFELSFLVQGSQGNDIFNESRIRLEDPNEGTSTHLLDRWTPQNQNTDVPAFIDQVTRANAGLVGGKISFKGDNGQLSRWVEDGSYVRLKSIMLAYSIPASVYHKIGLQRARIYVSAMNMITFTKYTGYDPEVSSYNSNDAQIGVDLSNYPTAKIVTFGIDITF